MEKRYIPLKSKGNTHVIDDADTVMVQYYDTIIVRFNRARRELVLNTGGFETVSTKARMNQFFNEYGLGLKVFSVKKNSGAFITR
jgi:hypothetical protein